MSHFDYVFNQKKPQLDNVAETWAQWTKLLSYLRNEGFEAEMVTRLNIKPMNTSSLDDAKKECNKAIVQNILFKRSGILSRRLRDDYSLADMEDRTDVSLLDGLLSEFADDQEDSVELIRSTRRNR